MIPQNYVKLEGKAANQMVKLMEVLDDHEDVQARLVELRHRGEGDRGLPGVRVFGIDPGSERTGYGCIETDGRRQRLVACGAIGSPRSHVLPRASSGHSRRTGTAARRMSARLRRDRKPVLRHERPQRLEARTCTGRCDGRGSGRGGRDREYTPAEIKRAVVGYGRADKHQVQQMVKLLLGLSAAPTPHDAADALAAAICHVNRADHARITGEVPGGAASGAGAM